MKCIWKVSDSESICCYYFPLIIGLNNEMSVSAAFETVHPVYFLEVSLQLLPPPRFPPLHSLSSLQRVALVWGWHLWLCASVCVTQHLKLAYGFLSQSLCLCHLLQDRSQSDGQRWPTAIVMQHWLYDVAWFMRHKNFTKMWVSGSMTYSRHRGRKMN